MKFYSCIGTIHSEYFHLRALLFQVLEIASASRGLERGTTVSCVWIATDNRTGHIIPIRRSATGQRFRGIGVIHHASNGVSTLFSCKGYQRTDLPAGHVSQKHDHELSVWR